MRQSKTNRFSVVHSLLAGVMILSVLCLTVQAQNEKKRERLGSSLKRLKWDAKKGETVEKKKPRESSRQSAGTTNEEAFRIETKLAVFDLLVVDQHGRFISGLTKEDFIVVEDGVPQQVGTFSLGDNAALSRSIILIIDYSTSQLPYLQTSFSAAKELIDQLGDNDKLAVVTD